MPYDSWFVIYMHYAEQIFLAFGAALATIGMIMLVIYLAVIAIRGE